MNDFSIISKDRCELGEGLLWSGNSNSLYFVDIERRTLLCHDLTTGSATSRIFHEKIGWVALTDDPRQLLIGLASGIYIIDDDLTSSHITLLVRVHPNQSPMRLNDAKVDRHGNLWFGSLNDHDQATSDGVLRCLDAHGNIHTVDHGYTVCNGPAIHPTDDIMLHTDSGRRTIYSFDMHPAGSLSNKRIWLQFNENEGFPDGMCFDREGCVWIAHWGGSCVSRYHRDGTLLRRIQLPATNISNICFGGTQLDRLFVTSARAGLSAERLAEETLAGAVFEIDSGGIRGVSPQKYPLHTFNNQA